MPLNYSSSEMSAHEQDLLNEQELENLQRQYLSMKNDAKLCKTHCDNFMGIQVRDFLNGLTKEQVDVDTNLKLAQSSAVKKKDIANLNDIANLRKAQLTFAEVVANESIQCDAMDITIQNLENEIEQRQKQVGGAILSHASHVGRLKKIRVYENRLNTATVQFNNLLTENTDLREKIEHFRKQRKVFNTLYKRLASKSSNLKYQIDDVIASATAAYNARDESHSKMMNLSERNSNDYKHFIEEEKEMTRIIAQESNLQEFMNTKNSEKSELAYQEALLRHQTHENRAEHQQEQEMIKFEKVLSAIISVLGEEQGNQLLNILRDESNKQAKIDSLTKAIQPVCDRYRKTEEQNFSLFQFVNEISHDVKRLNDQIKSIGDERSGQKADTQKKLSSNTITMTQVKCSLQEHESDVQNLELKLRATFENFNNVKGKIDSLFKTLKCDSAVLDDLLDNRREVTNENMGIYLASIENRINYLMEENVAEKAQKIEQETQIKPGTASQNTRKGASLQKRVTKEKKKDSTLNAPPSNLEFLDDIFGDLDDAPLDHSKLKDRAKHLMTERVRSVNTPRTPRRKTKKEL